MAKKKTLVEKVVEAVDHVIHPDAQPKPDQCPVTDEHCKKDCAIDECKATVSESVKSSPEKSGYASHPKFAKFKSTQGES